MTLALKEESLSIILDISFTVTPGLLQALMSLRRICGSVGKFLDVLILLSTDLVCGFISRHRKSDGPSVCEILSLSGIIIL